jgi:hypothetical protein
MKYCKRDKNGKVKNPVIVLSEFILDNELLILPIIKKEH